MSKVIPLPESIQVDSERRFDDERDGPAFRPLRFREASTLLRRGFRAFRVSLWVPTCAGHAGYLRSKLICPILKRHPAQFR